MTFNNCSLRISFQSPTFNSGKPDNSFLCRRLCGHRPGGISRYAFSIIWDNPALRIKQNHFPERAAAYPTAAPCPHGVRPCQLACRYFCWSRNAVITLSTVCLSRTDRLSYPTGVTGGMSRQDLGRSTGGSFQSRRCWYTGLRGRPLRELCTAAWTHHSGPYSYTFPNCQTSSFYT